MRRLGLFALMFATFVALPLGVIVGRATPAFVSGLVTGGLIYLVLRFLSMPFRR